MKDPIYTRTGKTIPFLWHS